MPERITQKHVETAFARLELMLPNAHLELDAYTPGTQTHYRISTTDGRTPFGNSWWIGAREAYEGIHLLINATDFLEKYY